jgi:8-oxo-dGTP diphosphatase
MTRLTRRSYSPRCPPAIGRERTETLEPEAFLITLKTLINDRAVVRAAGGVIVRHAADREPEVLLIHRSRQDDWTFPKGKLEPGESYQACALREVVEETGLRCLLGDELPQTSHIDHKGRLKIVRYWVMRPIAGEPEARYDVDVVRWLPVDRAVRLLTYDYDRPLLEALASVLMARQEMAPQAPRRS